MAQEPRFQNSHNAVGAQATTVGQGSGIEINRVLRNTYMLLGMTLAFAAFAAYMAMALQLGRPPFLIMIAGFFGLLFLVEKTADSAWGLLSCFLFTGFLGVTAGPVIGYYLSTSGPSLVVSALATASAAFVGLSAYALLTRKDFGFLSGFLVVGFFVLMGAVLVSWAFNLSVMHTAISAGFVIFASAAILWQTSAIIHGGERNYIRATTSLFVSFYNLFMSLLHLFGVMGDD